MPNSISNNLLARQLATNLEGAQRKLNKAATQIASGNQIISSGDDPANLSLGTGLRIDVDIFNTVLGSAVAAKSVLGVMDGALSQITEMLIKQKSLTAQSVVGGLSEKERSSLDLIFQQLADEINRMVGATNYNGVELIDGSLAGGIGQQTNIKGTNDASSLQITFAAAGTTTVAGGLVINGVTFDFDTNANESVSGATIVVDKTLAAPAKAQKIADLINNNSVTLVAANTANPQGAMTQANRDKLSDLVATVNGNTVSVSTKRNGGPAILVAAGGVAGTVDHVTTVQSSSNIYNIANGSVDYVVSSYAAGTESGSLGVMNSKVSGTMGHAIIQASTQTLATTGWVTVVTGDLINDSRLEAFGTTFTLKNDVTNDETQIKRSTTSDLQTLQNIANYLNKSDDPNIANFYYEVQVAGGANQLRATAKSATTSLNNANIDIGTTTTLSLNGGVANGIDTSRITDNEKFLGNISGFTAQMTATNQARLSVKVGDYTYSAVVSNTAPTTNTVVRMKTTDLEGKGGSFDIVLAANQGVAITSQDNADSFASNIDKAVKELTFYQTRKYTGFQADDLAIKGTVVSLTSENFDNVAVSDLKVDFNNNTQQGSLTVTLKDGRVLSAISGIGEQVNKGQLTQLTNVENSNESMNIIWGVNVDFSDSNARKLLSNDLFKAFKTDEGGMKFQVGLQADQAITVQIDDTSTKTLYGGKTLNILTPDKAAEAGEQLDEALDIIKKYRAIVGSSQSRFDFVTANIETSIQNIDAARAALLDADIPTATAKFALAQVMVQATISVLAQVNQLPQNLLKLIG